MRRLAAVGLTLLSLSAVLAWKGVAPAAGGAYASQPRTGRAQSPAKRASDAKAYFTAEFLERSGRYNRGQVALALAARAVRWMAYLTLLLPPFVPRLAARLESRLPGHANVRVLVVCAVVLAVTSALVLPISFLGFLQEHRYGLSRQSFLSWLGDVVKGFALWGAAFTLLTLLYFILRRRFPRFGWAVLAATVVAVAIPATLLYPVLVDPLFNRFRPLEDEALRRDLVGMADREGVTLKSVLVMDASAKTVRENAYFTGLGRTKRVVLWDNLLTNATPAELRQVFAHELGHWSRGHIVRGLLLWSAAVPLLCWVLWALHARLSRSPRLPLAGPTDPAGVPLLWLLLSLAFFVSAPISNLVSRAWEREADRVSLELTGDSETFIAGRQRSAIVNLSWVDPPTVWKWLFWTHPTDVERIRMAERWEER